MPGAGRRIYKPYLRHIDYTSQDFGIFNGEFKNVGKYEWSSESCDSICDIIDMPCDDSTFNYIVKLYGVVYDESRKSGLFFLC